MALYYDAASILSSESNDGSLKSRIYGSCSVKSKPAQIYALISETAKRDTFLKEVVDNAQLLKDEAKLTPLLALLLCHDHFFAKGGIAANPKHPLRLAVDRRKARLQSEFTRARLRRRCASIEALKAVLDREKGVKSRQHPRWMRVNTLSSNDDVAASLKLRKEDGMQSVLDSEVQGQARYCADQHVPHLFAVSPNHDLTKTQAYRQGELILQDKASCFPAYLLLGDEGRDSIGDVIDGCAAPGNKTTHAAAILAEKSVKCKVYACERDTTRSKILQTMTSKAGAGHVEVLAKQDFLALDPNDGRFSNVTHLLLDPSCSGSGILRREDIPKLALPHDARLPAKTKLDGTGKDNVKKRKLDQIEETSSARQALDEANVMEEETPVDATEERLRKLSGLQTRIVEHAMKFPVARRVTYSTCSIHEQENEVVVSRLLASEAARAQGWKVLARAKQVNGMRSWQHRGVRQQGANKNTENQLTEHQLEACIRCYPDDDEGTMGFFVCAFERQQGNLSAAEPEQVEEQPGDTSSVTEETDSWEGFD